MYHTHGYMYIYIYREKESEKESRQQGMLYMPYISLALYFHTHMLL
jgi:hypothetical protein